jgi:hypothetical protein
MSNVAHASLPVAVALLVFAAAARAVIWAQVDDPVAQRLAREYLEPLSTWCLVALAVHAAALGAAGELGALSLGLAVLLGAAAFLLRSLPEERAAAPAAPRPAAPAVPATPAAPATPRPAAPAVPATPATPTAAPPADSLWADDESRPRVGLWSR